MRTKIATSAKGLKVRGIAGTYVVLLAFDCPKEYTKGLLGFAIQRKDEQTGEVIWLRGLKRFDLSGGDEGDDVTTLRHPIQKFHWGDYTTQKGMSYTYTIHAMRGKAGALADADSVSVKVTCEDPDNVGKNGHIVHFNRSAASSQAFVKRFASLPTGDVVDPAARAWLSRGLQEALIGFIKGTKKGETLHLFVYEFTKEEFLSELSAAQKRGVTLEILFDGMLDAKGKGPSVDSIPAMKKHGLSAKTVSQPRTGAGMNISHNKFMVISNGKGKARAVWTGSTNWTDSGIYGQTNVGHAVQDAKVAQNYLDWHQDIWKAPNSSAADSRSMVMKLTALPKGSDAGVTLVLSPRKTIEAVTECAARVTAAEAMVCFTAPFALHKDLQAALAAAPAQVFGLLNVENVVGPELHKAPNTQLAAAAALNDKSVLEKWQKKLLSESMHHSGVHIHTKIILVDPLSDNPLVVTGSANFSNNSSVNNDENQLFIFGETAVADIYLGEFMRMFDHYYFRSHVLDKDKSDVKDAFLDATDGWTKDFFAGRPKEKLRLSFF